jgi:hypothetical protein
MPDGDTRPRRVGRATIFFTALLCVAAPVPAFAQHTAPGACASSLTTLGRVAFGAWIAAAAVVLVSVVADVTRGRRWSLLALPLCAFVSMVGLVLIFARSPLCFS